MVVYESSDLRAYWVEGSPEALLVTFSHVGHGDADGTFFGRNLVRASGMSALGIVDRRDRWFPHAAMAELLTVVVERTATFRHVILFGSSMGAYGALRYSRALHATSVIAWAPQWSIAPHDLGDADYRYRRYFDSACHADMAVRSEDIDGQAFIFFDPHEPSDRFHALRLAELAPAHVFHIQMPMLGHEVGHAFASTASMLQLFSACREGNCSLIQTLARTVRRRAPRRALGISLALLDRRPACAETLFGTIRSQVSPALRMSWVERAVWAACRRGAMEDASRHMIDSADLEALYPRRFEELRRRLAG